MWRKMATLGIWTILVLLSTNVSAPAAELTKLRVGILIAGEFGPTYIALKKGSSRKRACCRAGLFQGDLRPYRECLPIMCLSS